MKILMVITGMRSGGAERVMATLCNELSKRNTVRLLILKDLNCDYSLSDNVEIVTGNVKHQNFLKSISVIKNQIDNWKPDVVLSFMTKTNIVSIVAKLLSTCKVPIVIAERANPYNAKDFQDY